MSSDSSSQYDVNVLYDDDELISRSGSQSSVIIEAESTPCFHSEQPNFIPPTTSQTPPSTPGYQIHSFLLTYLLKLHSAREVGDLLAALIRKFISNAPLPTNHKREMIQLPV